MKTISLAVLVAFVAAVASAETGVAKITGTALGSTIAGMASFEDTPAGLKVAAIVRGLPAGAHGFHIHEWGSCEDSAKAAGSHFNPAHAAHGKALQDGPEKAHAGDMGNIIADAKGNAKLDAVIPNVSLTGKFAVIGRAVVVHEKVDDFSQPVGNAGNRVGCGVIGVTGPVAAPSPAPAAK